MFKRVEKRRRKQDEEEKLGLDQEMKEMLGMHDTDSDESSSSSGSDDESEGEEDAQQSMDRTADGGDGDEDEDEEDSSDNAAEGSDSEADGEPPVSIAEALKNPLYTVTLDPDVHECIVCPGKLLKNATMCEVHRSSNAHVRRYKHFTELARKAKPDQDVRKLVDTLQESPKESNDSREGLSHRAQKRQEKQARIKAKRRRQKEAKAKALAQRRRKQLRKSKQSLQ